MSASVVGVALEATTVFDAERLKEIIDELGEPLQPLIQDRRLQDAQQTITLVDVSLIAALPKMMEASWRKAETGTGQVKRRLHTHFEILRGIPTRIDVTPNGGGRHDERVMLAATIEPDHLYATDRGYAKFVLFNQIVDRDSSGVDSDGILRISTNLLDVPAEVIGLIFSKLWAEELFFQFFKHLLGCRHLLSADQNGIEIQTYCALIACMLIALWTGKQPTLRTYEMICFYFIRLADEGELMQHHEKRKPQVV